MRRRSAGATTNALASIALLAVCGVGATRQPIHAAPNWLVITWGQNSPEWNRKLDVSGLREGCSGAPAACLRELTSPDHEKVFLAIILKNAIAGDYGRQYGALSHQKRNLVEIGLDDFGGQYEKLFLSGMQDPPAALNALIDGVKNGNPRIAFGLTIYEDDLETPYLSDAKFPAATRAKIDYVHFYIHYRADTPQTARYVQQLQTIFPKAKVILGIYAYDRNSYLPCSKGGSPCLPQEELNYLRQGVTIDVGLLKDGTAVGLEFWPGSFGQESEWKGWDEPRICTGSKSACIENTIKMRQLVADEFTKAGI